jgi:predicted DsbA family dithiol-disulfide isomerase
MPLPPAAPGSIAVYSDIGCPWARLCIHRLRRIRRTLGLDGAVPIEHRPFPLELVNRRPTPKSVVEAEAAVLATLDDSVEWRMWEGPVAGYPVTTLPAMEAVQAAAEQSDAAAEQLDVALRDALFRHSRCISILPVVLDVARRIPGLDPAALEDALAAGRHRGAVSRVPERVTGSPHLVLADGQDAFNPGMRVRMLEGHFPVVESDGGVAALDELLRRAAPVGSS